MTSRLPHEILLPGDKSLSHRVLLLAALAATPSCLAGLNGGEDVQALLRALQNLGVPITQRGEDIQVTGMGLGGLRPATAPLDLENSGTAARLLLGVLSAHPFETTLVGDDSLTHRPMGRVMEPLRQMGVQFHAREERYLPITLRGNTTGMPADFSGNLGTICRTHSLTLASAQVKSALLLAGLQWPGVTQVEEKNYSRDHTERLFNYLGIEWKEIPSSQGRLLELRGGSPFAGKDFSIPKDPSAAAFFALAATILPNASFSFHNLLWNPFRNVFFFVLQQMGGALSLNSSGFACGEKVVTLEVKSAPLKGIDLPASLAPRLIDEYPILACAAACGSGRSIFRGLGELRYKESDRLAKIQECLECCGIESGIQGDDLWIQGSPGKIRGGGAIDPGLDHRIAMAFSILNLKSESPLEIKNPHVVRSSFPQFWEELEKIKERL